MLPPTAWAEPPRQAGRSALARLAPGLQTALQGLGRRLRDEVGAVHDRGILGVPFGRVEVPADQLSLLLRIVDDAAQPTRHGLLALRGRAQVRIAEQGLHLLHPDAAALAGEELQAPTVVCRQAG